MHAGSRVNQAGSVGGNQTETYLARLSTDRSSPMVEGI
jgi:hypothetical protein